MVHDRQVMRDDASDMSDYTRNLLRKRFTVLAFKAGKNKEAVPPTTVEDRAAKMARLWTSKTVTKKLQRKEEENSKDKDKDKDKKENGIAALAGFKVTGQEAKEKKPNTPVIKEVKEAPSLNIPGLYNKSPQKSLTQKPDNKRVGKNAINANAKTNKGVPLKGYSNPAFVKPGSELPVKVSTDEGPAMNVEHDLVLESMSTENVHRTGLTTATVSIINETKEPTLAPKNSPRPSPKLQPITKTNIPPNKITPVSTSNVNNNSNTKVKAPVTRQDSTKSIGTPSAKAAAPSIGTPLRPVKAPPAGSNTNILPSLGKVPGHAWAVEDAEDTNSKSQKSPTQTSTIAQASAAKTPVSPRGIPDTQPDQAKAPSKTGANVRPDPTQTSQPPKTTPVRPKSAKGAPNNPGGPSKVTPSTAKTTTAPAKTTPIPGKAAPIPAKTAPNPSKPSSTPAKTAPTPAKTTPTKGTPAPAKAAPTPAKGSPAKTTAGPAKTPAKNTSPSPAKGKPNQPNLAKNTPSKTPIAPQKLEDTSNPNTIPGKKPPSSPAASGLATLALPVTPTTARPSTSGSADESVAGSQFATYTQSLQNPHANRPITGKVVKTK